MKPFRINAEIVTGKCPTCEEITMLVGLTKQYFRCMTAELILNNILMVRISYIPALSKNTLQSDLESTLAKAKDFKQGSTRTCVSQNEYWT